MLNALVLLNLSFQGCGSPFFSIGRSRPQIPKPPSARPAASRILRALAFLIVIVLLSTTLPFWVGAAFTVVGLFFAVWARRHLGSNWSRSVTIKQCHKLITTGP